jgi:Na+/H+ antiporter NhaD/arsenite permease-like protein
VLPLVAGLFLIVEALDSTGGLRVVGHVLDKLTEWPPLAANLATAFGFAGVSNLINNLPVGLIGAGLLHASPLAGQFANAMLIGTDLGPNLSVSASIGRRIASSRSSQSRMSYRDEHRLSSPRGPAMVYLWENPTNCLRPWRAGFDEAGLVRRLS